MLALSLGKRYERGERVGDAEGENNIGERGRERIRDREGRGNRGRVEENIIGERGRERE